MYTHICVHMYIYTYVNIVVFTRILTPPMHQAEANPADKSPLPISPTHPQTQTPVAMSDTSQRREGRGLRSGSTTRTLDSSVCNISFLLLAG